MQDFTATAQKKGWAASVCSIGDGAGHEVISAAYQTREGKFVPVFLVVVAELNFSFIRMRAAFARHASSHGHNVISSVLGDDYAALFLEKCKTTRSECKDQ